MISGAGSIQLYNVKGGGCKGKERWYKGWKEIQSEKKNKAGYSAISVACGWAGVVFEVI